MEEKYQVILRGGEAYELNATEIGQLEVFRSGSELMIWLDGKKYITEAREISEKRYEVRIEGITFEFELRDALDQKIQEMGLADEIASGLGDVVAPMPGLVLETNATEGEEVKKGAPVIILEAMKMENVIKAPADGIISKLLVKKGETVDKNAVLFTLE